jgi:hypothetical protein
VRKSRAYSDHNLPRERGMNSATCEDFSDLIPRHFGDRRHAVKLLARMSGATERAAKNWVAGRNAPQIQHLIPIMANCEALAAEIMERIEARKCPQSSSPSAREGSDTRQVLSRRSVSGSGALPGAEAP